MKFFDLTDPTFAPVRSRDCFVVVCVLWSLFELFTGQIEWAIVVLGLGASSGVRFWVNDHDCDRDG